MNVPLQQTKEFAQALAAYGADVVGDTPVILQRRFGPLGTLAFASRAKPDCIAETPVRLLNGETPCPKPYRAAGFRQIITPAHVAEWDLTASDLRAGLHGKWRNQLVKGERQGLRISKQNWAGRPHWLFDHAEQLARSRKYRALPTGLLSIFAKQNPNAAQIYEASLRGTPVAACLILRHGPVATYQTAWSAPEGLSAQAPRCLLFHAACQMVKLGHDVLDLGVVETDTAPGLARFKLGTGAAVRPLGGTWFRLRGR